ncbi:MAG: helix-turn-helix domain-containing protein [Sphingomonadaceae bacterium]
MCALPPVLDSTDCTAGACQHCAVRPHCLPGAHSAADCSTIESLVLRRRRVLRGEDLFLMEDQAHHRLYAIRSGAFKTYLLKPDGQQRVTGFLHAGAVLGLQSIGLDRQPLAASALSDSVVCEFSSHDLHLAASKSPSLAHRFYTLMSKELARQQSLSCLLRNDDASPKLAAFLLWQAGQAIAAGQARPSFQLLMSRQDIGDFLGLTGSTVSRVLGRFIDTACVRSVRRHIIILDLPLLLTLAQADPAVPR